MWGDGDDAKAGVQARSTYWCRSVSRGWAGSARWDGLRRRNGFELGGVAGWGCWSLSLSLSLPPPKIFWKMFFFSRGGLGGTGERCRRLVVGWGRPGAGLRARVVAGCSGWVVRLCGRRCRRASGKSSGGIRTSGCRYSAGLCRRGRRHRRKGWGRWSRRGGCWSLSMCWMVTPSGTVKDLTSGVLGKLNGALHELGPDGRGGVGATELDASGVVVVADPIRYRLRLEVISGEPGIVAGPGLACGGSVEANDRARGLQAVP